MSEKLGLEKLAANEFKTQWHRGCFKENRKLGAQTN
jgi:hypothetical protein